MSSYINLLLILLFSQFVQWKHNLDREVYYMDMGENLTVCLTLIHEQLVQGCIECCLSFCHSVLDQCDSKAMES